MELMDGVWACGDGGITGGGTAGVIPLFSAAEVIADSLLVQKDGKIGVGTATPVAGGIKIGTTDSCGAATEGTLRYSATLKTMEFCNGSEWKPLMYDVCSFKVFTSCKHILDSDCSTDGANWNGDPGLWGSNGTYGTLENKYNDYKSPAWNQLVITGAEVMYQRRWNGAVKAQVKLHSSCQGGKTYFKDIFTS